METALSFVRQLPSTKSQVAMFSDQIRQSLLSGDVEPLELAVYFKAIEKMMESVKETLTELSLAEAEKYGKGEFEFKGAKIVVKELGTKYDYSNCGDRNLEKCNTEISALTEERKGRENFLKSLQYEMTIVDEETGETTKLYPPVKSSTTGISISLK